MSDICTTRGVFKTIVLTLLVGFGAVFIFNAGCAGETPAEEPALLVPDAPEPPDKQTPVDTECDYPDLTEQCKTSKGEGFTCNAAGACVECLPGISGCPCVGDSSDLSRRYCLDGGGCLKASSSPSYSQPFCGWCLPGSGNCPCVEGSASKCAPGLKCVAVGESKSVCLKNDCLEAGSFDGASCACAEGGVCDVTDDVCWEKLCRTCPDSVKNCPCSETRSCSKQDGLVCDDAPGESGVKRCVRAADCAGLGCETNVLCCDSNNADLDVCKALASDDHVKCLEECVPGWINSGSGTCNDCADGFYGANCASECPGGALSPCSGNGECLGGAAGAGTCECKDGFFGADCADCRPGFFGEACTACPGPAGAPCHNNGVCSDGAAGSGVCVCTTGAGWTGNDCSVCPQGYQQDNGKCVQIGVTCSSACGSHGQCEKNAATGVSACACHQGWTGDACDACSVGHYGAACDRCPGPDGAPCNNHGDCSEGLSGTGACTCAAGTGWSGSECGQCPDDYNTANGGCLAPGVQCSTTCAHGTCVDDGNGAGKCDCDAGWDDSDNCNSCLPGHVGAACTECPGGAASPCSGHGTCETDGTCSCSPGWYGEACEKTCGAGERLNNGDCEDIDECDSNNGGCGPQARVLCANAQNSGDAALCSCRDDSVHWANVSRGSVLTCQTRLVVDVEVEDQCGADGAEEGDACGDLERYYHCSGGAKQNSCSKCGLNSTFNGCGFLPQHDCQTVVDDDGPSYGKCVAREGRPPKFRVVPDGNHLICVTSAGDNDDSVPGGCEVIDGERWVTAGGGFKWFNYASYHGLPSCQLLCEQTNECTHFSYDNTNGLCFLHDASKGHAQSTEADENFSRGKPKGAECGSSTSSCQYTASCEEEPLEEPLEGPQDCSVCKAGYWGANCNNTCPGGAGSDACNGNGSCDDGVDGDGSCTCTANTGWEVDEACGVCAQGWENGDGLCNVETNECEPDPCQNGALCSDKFNDYRCDCPVGNNNRPQFLGKNCQTLARDNIDGVALVAGLYVGGGDEGASNGCAGDTGSDQVFIPGADPSQCVSGCCEVMPCQKWDDCTIADTFCTQAYSLADKAYCLPRHPALREEQKNLQPDKLLAINLGHKSITEDSPLFMVREASGKKIFEWNPVKQAAIVDYTTTNDNNLRCNTNELEKGNLPKGLKCRSEAGFVADANCDGMSFQAQCGAEDSGGRCLGDPNEGLTGAIWPVTDGAGKAVCITKENYSLDETNTVKRDCDGDGDGWVSDTAYAAYVSPHMAVRANARCNVRLVSNWVLVNEYRQKLKVPVNDITTKTGESGAVPEWVCPSDKACLPLIETSFLDGSNETDGSPLSGNQTDREGYQLTNADTRVRSFTFEASMLNPMKKSCTSSPDRSKSDYNKNNVLDWEENQDSTWGTTGFGDIYNELQGYTFFRELYIGEYEPSGGGSYVIQERPRCDLSDVVGNERWPKRIPLGFEGNGDGDDGHWMSCMRAPGDVVEDLNLAYDGKAAVNHGELNIPGYDFSRFYWAEKKKLRNNVSGAEVEPAYNAENYASYVVPVVSKDKLGSVGVGGFKDGVQTVLEMIHRPMMGIVGGWCSVSEDQNAGTFVGDSYEHVGGTRIAKHREVLSGLIGQSFKVVNDKMVPDYGCWGCVWRGMNHYSQFQCVQVVDVGNGNGWTPEKLEGKGDYEYVLNECEMDPDCEETGAGDCVRCRKLKMKDGNATCATTSGATCPEQEEVTTNYQKVGFVAVRYKFESRDDCEGQLDKRFCPNKVGGGTNIGQRGDLPRKLRGCVAEEFYEDEICPGPSFKDLSRQPMIRGASESRYGKAGCYKELLCGDGVLDPGERCDYRNDPVCEDSGIGACLCTIDDCTDDSSTVANHHVCEHPEQLAYEALEQGALQAWLDVIPDGRDTSRGGCGTATCTKSLPNSRNSQTPLEWKAGGTGPFVCDLGHKGGGGWKCETEEVVNCGDNTKELDCTQCAQCGGDCKVEDTVECGGGRQAATCSDCVVIPSDVSCAPMTDRETTCSSCEAGECEWPDCEFQQAERYYKCGGGALKADCSACGTCEGSGSDCKKVPVTCGDGDKAGECYDCADSDDGPYACSTGSGDDCQWDFMYEECTERENQNRCIPNTARPPRYHADECVENPGRAAYYAGTLCRGDCQFNPDSGECVNKGSVSCGYAGVADTCSGCFDLQYMEGSMDPAGEIAEMLCDGDCRVDELGGDCDPREFAACFRCIEKGSCVPRDDVNQRYRGVVKEGDACTPCPKGTASASEVGESCEECDGVAAKIFTPPGEGTCSKKCLVTLTDLDSIAVVVIDGEDWARASKPGCTNRDPVDGGLAQDESCTLRCKDGYYFIDEIKDGYGEEQNGVIKVTCNNDNAGKELPVQCVPIERDIEDYDVPGSLQSEIMLWVDASFSESVVGGNGVGVVRDVSGKGHHLDGIVDKPTVTEDGDLKWLKFDGNAALGRNSAESMGNLKTLFIVFKPNEAITSVQTKGLLSLEKDFENAEAQCGRGIFLGGFPEQEIYGASVGGITAAGGSGDDCGINDGGEEASSMWKSGNTELASPVLHSGGTYLIVLSSAINGCNGAMAVNVTRIGKDSSKILQGAEIAGRGYDWQCRLARGSARMGPVPVFSVVLGKAKTAYRPQIDIPAVSAQWPALHNNGNEDLWNVGIVQDFYDGLHNSVYYLSTVSKKRFANRWKEKFYKFRYLLRDNEGKHHIYCLNSWTEKGPCAEWDELDSVPTKKGWSRQWTAYDRNDLKLYDFLRETANIQWTFLREKIDLYESGDKNIAWARWSFAGDSVDSSGPGVKHFKGRIGELIMFKEQLSIEQVNRVRVKLIDKWREE